MIRFELLTEENLESVWELEKVCFQDPWTLKMFESEIDNDISVFIVAVDEETDNVVAYAGVWLTLDFGDITNIAVHPDYRREGLGSRLLSTVIDLIFPFWCIFCEFSVIILIVKTEYDILK